MTTATPEAARGPVRTGERLRAWRGHLVLGLVGLACVFPIYWMYATSLRRPGDVFDTEPLPWPPSLDSYAEAAREIDVLGLLTNTAVVAAGVAVGQLLVALLAAYAFAAYRFRGEKLLYLAMIGTWLVPFQVTMLPNYVLLYQ